MRFKNIKMHKADLIVDIIGICPKCGNDVVFRKTSYGNFENCINYPQCRYIKKIYNKDQIINKSCPQCGNDLLIRIGKFGKFIACSNYPRCKYFETNSNVLEEQIKSRKSNDKMEEYSRKFKKGIRDDVEQDVMSSWEANIIRLFNHLEIKYKYESDAFNLGKIDCDYKFVSAVYVPDFVLDDGTLIEVKGHLDYRSLQNIRRFEELYPNEKLVIIDSDIYYLLEKKYGDVIPNWEKSSAILTSYVTVVGITIPERKKYVDKLNNNDEIFLIREPDNKFDKNAIKVIDKENNHLGYISGDYACYYAPKIDKGIKYKIIVKECKEKVLNCSIIALNLDDFNVSNFFNLF